MIMVVFVGSGSFQKVYKHDPPRHGGNKKKTSAFRASRAADPGSYSRRMVHVRPAGSGC